MGITKDFKLEELSKYFHLPEKAVAKELGICLTSLKKLCRSYGITRWPFRKLKSIQRTLAKVQDEQGGAAVAAGGGAAGGAGDAASGAASLAAAGLAAPAAAGAGMPVAAGASAAVPAGAAGGAAAPAAGVAGGTATTLTPVTAITGGGGATAGGAKVPTAKRRKPFQINGRSVLMTDEEKSIYELTLGKPGATDVTPVSVPAKPHGKASAAGGAGKAGAGASGGQAQGGEGGWDAWGSNGKGGKKGGGGAFSCRAAGTDLEVRNWATLWTKEHLQKRLLEPLGGSSLSFSAKTAVATLHFDNERTAQRAELICNAAAAAAEKNLKGTPSQPASRSSPNVVGDSNPGSNDSEQSPAWMGGDAYTVSPTLHQGSSSSPTLQLLIPQSGSGGLFGAPAKVVQAKGAGTPGGGGGGQPPTSGGGTGMNPFKASPQSPPTSYTSPLFEMHAYPSSGSLDALMMPHTSSAMGFDFHYGDHTAEVPSSSIMAHSDAMPDSHMHLGGDPGAIDELLLPRSPQQNPGSNAVSPPIGPRQPTSGSASNPPSLTLKCGPESLRSTVGGGGLPTSGTLTLLTPSAGSPGVLIAVPLSPGAAPTLSPGKMAVSPASAPAAAAAEGFKGAKVEAKPGS